MLFENPGLEEGDEFTFPGLNPCFTGICSLSEIALSEKDIELCLNPCFTGICSLRCKQNNGCL